MLSEDALISFIAKKFTQTNKKNFGIGDDAAVLNVVGLKNIVMSTDSLVENTHFKREWSSPKDLAHKTLHVNLSDIAAMGAVPWLFFLNLKIPIEENSRWLKEYLSHLAYVSKKNHCPLMGGNLARSDKGFSADVSIIGRLPKNKIKMRSGAKAGDLICVGAPLGLSLAGYRLLKTSNRIQSADEKYLISQHLRPEAQLKLGAILSGENSVTSMMDVSDGLAQDLPKLLKASGCGAQVNFDQFPIETSLLRVCQKKSWNAHEFFWCGGEDYKLLFTVKNKSFPILAQRLARKGLHVFSIGHCNNTQRLELCSGQKLIKKTFKNFSHF